MYVSLTVIFVLIASRACFLVSFLVLLGPDEQCSRYGYVYTVPLVPALTLVPANKDVLYMHVLHNFKLYLGMYLPANRNTSIVSIQGRIQGGGCLGCSSTPPLQLRQHICFNGHLAG